MMPKRRSAPDESRPCPGPALSRRSLLSASGSGMLALLGGCAITPSTAPSSPRPPATASVDLLYFADTLDARSPSPAIRRATHLGPAGYPGHPPWLTSASANTVAGPLEPAVRRLVTGAASGEEPPVGGLALMAARLATLRASLGEARTLTLENGQCWNGSGLCHLTRGAAGLAASQLMGAEARVSSDERLLWPTRAAGLYRDFPGQVLGTLDGERNPGSIIKPLALFDRGGARIAVVGVTDPHAFDERRTLDTWFDEVRQRAAEARQQADLVVLLADTGTGPGLWLAERLEDADLLLCARGQDFWPSLIEVRQASGRPLPVCLPGCRGSGIFQITCRGGSQRWEIAARFHPIAPDSIDAATRQQAARLQPVLDRARTPYAGWLDAPLASAPAWLWRRDTVGGSWDGLLLDAMQRHTGAEVALSPGWRHDVVLPPGSPITRDHLITLTGSHEARIVELSTDQGDLHALLERAADHCFGTPLLLDDALDLPRLKGVEWTCRYTSDTGRRIDLARVTGNRLATWSHRPEAAGGDSLWQVMEAFLADQPEAWSLPALPGPTLRFVDGHPGWHPEGRRG